MNAIVTKAWFEEDVRSARLLGFALLATFIGQMIGAVLKRAPMHARFSARHTPAIEHNRSNNKFRKWARLRTKNITSRYNTFFRVLLFLHFVLSSLVVFLIPVLLDVSKYGWTYFLCIPFMFIPTILVLLALSPPKPDEPRPTGWRAHPVTETVANLGLFSYALINQLFWTSWLTPNAPLTTTAEVPMRALQSFLFLVPVTLMYFFSPRLLFLAEELEDSRTRISMTFAVASIVFRWVVGAGPGSWPWVG